MSARPSSERMFPMRTVVLGAFLPSLLFETGVGLALPLIPISATRLGGDLTVAAAVAALLPVGRILADIPAGALATKVGDSRAMLLAALVGVAGFVGAAVAPALWLLGLSVLGLGATTAVFHLARQTYLTAITPVHRRARVLSTLAGVHRVGYFIGPFVGAGAVARFSIPVAYGVAAVFAALTVAVLLLVRPAQDDRPQPAPGAPPTPHGGMRAIVRSYRRLFLTLGVGILLVGAVRGARQTVLPLWGEYQGLDPEVVSLIFGLSAGLDMVLFYPAGKVMDSFGRLWVAIPSMLLMALTMVLLPFTGTVATIAVVGAVLGVANGIGSGIVMTLGSDVAPRDDRSRFLGVWRLLQDCGDAAGPLTISLGAALGSLAAGIWATAAFGVGAAAALARWAPRYSEHANRTTRRRAGLTDPGRR